MHGKHEVYRRIGHSCPEGYGVGTEKQRDLVDSAALVGVITNKIYPVQNLFN